MNTHSCIKCKATYVDNDPEPYYCSPCNEERKRAAADIDAKRANIIAEPSVSALQQFDSLPKINGFVDSRYL